MCSKREELVFRHNKVWCGACGSPMRTWRHSDIGTDPIPDSISADCLECGGHMEGLASVAALRAAVSAHADRCFMHGLQRMMELTHTIARDHGWHDKEQEDGTYLALIHAELSEALEGLRNGNPQDKHIPAFTSQEAELADAVIRIMDYAKQRNLRLAEAIMAKMEYNKQREYRHGGKEF